MPDDDAAPAAGPDPAAARLRAEARRIARPSKVLVWGLWDWASAAFNAVITTFVFSVYLTNEDLFGEGADGMLAAVLAVAGVVIALIAPVTGQRADRSGHRALNLALYTGVIAVVTACMFFVAPAVQADGSFEAQWLWLGLILLAVGNVASELAGVNYNAMLNDISTPRNVGRVSGFGWGMGYVGGIVLLLVVYFGLINPEVGLFGVTSENGMDVRVTTLVAAAWTVLFSAPLVVTSLRDSARLRDRTGAEAEAPKESIVQSYKRLLGSIASLWRTDRRTVWFLLASAVFRDGLAGVFTFGGIIAAGTFGFSAGEVIIFAVAANVVAGVATISFGLLDDRFGPKRVIVISLVSMVVAGIGIFALHDLGASLFWVLGLVLCVFVGPAQSASRTFLARLIPPGKDGEVFGLYATTGRAVSFLAPSMFAVALWVGRQVTDLSGNDVQYWGILGIVLVLAVGLALLIPVSARDLTPPRDARR
ncbi:MFS transporter [Georgenia sp. Z1344]|uniref:MFS transporter n=1 Tax=Georgenia sp. Z1344 TaxID=3416706 RepID=UPI003CFA5935